MKMDTNAGWTLLTVTRGHWVAIWGSWFWQTCSPQDYNDLYDHFSDRAQLLRCVDECFVLNSARTRYKLSLASPVDYVTTNRCFRQTVACQ